MGLGLAIVSRLAALLGAEVQVASREKRGSRFSFMLPPEREVITAAVSEPAVVGSRGRVLIVEDDPIVRFSVAALMQEWGCDPVSAASAEEALDLAAREGRRYDAIVADHRLGG